MSACNAVAVHAIQVHGAAVLAVQIHGTTGR